MGHSPTPWGLVASYTPCVERAAAEMQKSDATASWLEAVDPVSGQRADLAQALFVDDATRTHALPGVSAVDEVTGKLGWATAI
eukprot:5862673-Lingulodinium_polyedra.AAC.1